MIKKNSVFMENISIEISKEVTKFLRESHVVETFLYYDLIKYSFTIYSGGVYKLEKNKEYL